MERREPAHVWNHVGGQHVLINTDLNKYDGLAAVHTRKGTQKFLELDVWADPSGSMFYQMNASSASNLIDAAKEEEPDRCWSESC